MEEHRYKELTEQLAVLREINKTYKYKTIENIIQSMEAVVKEFLTPKTK